jgi:hypothetical protein
VHAESFGHVPGPPLQLSPVFGLNPQSTPELPAVPPLEAPPLPDPPVFALQLMVAVRQ